MARRESGRHVITGKTAAGGSDATSIDKVAVILADFITIVTTTAKILCTGQMWVDFHWVAMGSKLATTSVVTAGGSAWSFLPTLLRFN